MQVIFLQNVPKIGKKYDVKEVSDGHALNFLFPRRLAEKASPDALARLEKIKSQGLAVEQINTELLAKNFGALRGATVSMTAKANAKGHLFKGIHKEELIPEIKSQIHVDIDPEHLVMEKPIKEVGDHTLEVRVGDLSANFTLSITGAGE